MIISHENAEDLNKKNARLERFKDHLKLSSEYLQSNPKENLISPTNIKSTSSIFHNTGHNKDYSSNPHGNTIKGTSLKLEKPYLRLTSAPNPMNIRPLKILKLALQNVKEKYVTNGDYTFACEQLKSIRQDLTVQNINIRFTAHVYETHARIALESGDLPEFNQCQSRLQELKMKGIPISVDEFNCYIILHGLFQENYIELIPTLMKIASEITISPNNEDTSATHYALQVVKAVRSRNTYAFFQLYSLSPHLSGYIMDFMLSKMRNIAYDQLVKSHTTLSLIIVQQMLHFISLKECKRFLNSKSAVLIEMKDELSGMVSLCLDTKETLKTTLSTIIGENIGIKQMNPADKSNISITKNTSASLSHSNKHKKHNSLKESKKSNKDKHHKKSHKVRNDDIIVVDRKHDGGHKKRKGGNAVDAEKMLVSGLSSSRTDPSNKRPKTF